MSCVHLHAKNAKSNLRAAISKEVCFISKGFSNWEIELGANKGAS